MLMWELEAEGRSWGYKASGEVEVKDRYGGRVAAITGGVSLQLAIVFTFVFVFGLR
jgi:hypothetical protein